MPARGTFCAATVTCLIRCDRVAALAPRAKTRVVYRIRLLVLALAAVPASAGVPLHPPLRVFECFHMSVFDLLLVRALGFVLAAGGHVAGWGGCDGSKGGSVPGGPPCHKGNV